MPDFRVPVCFFPTTTLFIDDHQGFILDLVLHVEEHFAFRMVTSPYEALKYLKEQHRDLAGLYKHVVNESKSYALDPPANHHCYMSFVAIYSEIYNARRFEEISVLVVDHAMKGMDGLRFCSTIPDATIKKILLIHSMEEKLAQDAVKNGIIDAFVLKDQADVNQSLLQKIHVLQKQYFLEMSWGITKALAIQVPTCLSDVKFIDFFAKLRARHRTVEYYLIDDSGSFLLMDQDARLSCWMVKTLQECEMYSLWAEQHGIETALLDELRRGKKIPAFFPKDRPSGNWTESWKSILPATPFVIMPHYFYAYVEGGFLLDINSSLIKSFHEFLEELDMEELLFR